jgi:hypothetical protein
MFYGRKLGNPENQDAGVLMHLRYQENQISFGIYHFEGGHGL